MKISDEFAQNAAIESGKFPHPLTLEYLDQMRKDFEEQHPKLPPYYRVNRRTYEAVRRLCIPASSDFMRTLASVELRIDDSVPDGEALPPIGEV